MDEEINEFERDVQHQTSRRCSRMNTTYDLIMDTIHHRTEGVGFKQATCYQFVFVLESWISGDIFKREWLRCESLAGEKQSQRVFG